MAHAKTVTNLPTLTVTAGNTTAAYADKQQIGSLLTIPAAVLEQGGTGHLVSVAVVCNLMTSPAFALHFFKADPSVTSTDRQTLTVSDANMAANYLGTYEITTTDYKVGANNHFAFSSDRTRVPIVAAASSTSIYCIPVATAAMSLTGADLSIRLGIMAD